jgi:hypothetical protein
MDLQTVWQWLSEPSNQKTLAWLGGGLVVAAGGLWTAITFFLNRTRAEKNSGPAAPVRAASGGVAAGRDVHFRTSRGMSGGHVIALVLVVVGALLLAAGLFGDRIAATGGVAVGGDVKNSTISVTGGGGKKP